MKLIDNWRAAWRFWSVQLGALGAALTAVLIAFPDAAVTAWAFMPGEFKSAIPAQYIPLIGVAVFVLSIVARIVKQSSLHEEAKQNANN